MIRIETETDALYAAIAAHRPSWLAKAKSRKAMFRRMGRYVEGQDFWGEIKDIYIELQHEKCAYCETRLAGRELGSKVHEVEHFRPKSRVKTWPPASGKGAVGFVPPCRLGRASRRGYYLLAYHPLNYVIACTRCNSTLKADYFPIRRARGTGAAHPQTAMAEDPLLIYPLGHLDVDPASLIRFEGVLAVPRHGRGRGFERALVTIAFFQLNHQDLCSRRARLLGALWLSLRTLDTPGLPAVLIQYHQHAVDAAQDAAGEFAACARDFVALHRSDPALADQLGEAAAAMSR